MKNRLQAKRSPGMRTSQQAAFGPDDWDFRFGPEYHREVIPIGLEWNALQYELLREQLPFATGLTLKCICAKWPWWPRPWLSGWKGLSPEQKSNFKLVHVERANLSFWQGTLRDLSGKDSRIASYRELVEARGELDDDDDELEPVHGPSILTFVGLINLEARRADIVAAFSDWLEAHLPERKDVRRRPKEHLRQLGAFRVARHAAGKTGMEEFTFGQPELTKARQIIGARVGWREYDSQSAWCDAVRQTRARILS